MRKLNQEAFVNTQNVAKFEDLMIGLERGAGEGRIACVYGRAGRGKTRAVSRYHVAHGRSLYLRALRIWADSPGAFLKALLWEQGVRQPPGRNDDRHRMIVDLLIDDGSPPVFIDEIEKLPGRFLEVVRDLTDLSCSPFVLVGEEELYYALARKRRCWSRTMETLEFDPLDLAGVMAYSIAAIGYKLPGAVARVFHEASGGDFRLVKRDLGLAARRALARNKNVIDEGLAREAVKAGLRSKPKRQA